MSTVRRRAVGGGGDVDEDVLVSGCEGTGSAGASTPAATMDNEETKKRAKKKKDHAVRMFSTWMMTATILTVLYCGHIALCAFVFMCGAAIFGEILNLRAPPDASRGSTGVHFRTVNWGFFTAASYFVYGKSVLAHFSEQGYAIMDTRAVQLLMRHHSFIAFCMYVVFFLAFVMTLRAGAYMMQFGAFARAHIALLLVLLSTSMTVLNIKNGLVWFVLPATLVIINDSFAYLVGRKFGKTKLVALSPNKTVEGFIGGAVFTVLTASLCAWALTKLELPQLYCPKPSFSDCGVLLCRATCERPALFTQTLLQLPPGHDLVLKIRDALGLAARFAGRGGVTAEAAAAAAALKIAPIQLHALSLALFASVIAPFGGFFASGLKRAFEVKDFADLIPGHGGVTDRMDCQLLMAVFTYVYSINFVAAHAPDVEKLMALAAELSIDERTELLTELAGALVAKGVDAAAALAPLLSKAPPAAEAVAHAAGEAVAAAAGAAA